MIKQPDYVLETQKVSKSYGSIDALENASLRFAPDKIYGLFGRNGAGKTTLLNIMTSRIYAEQGRVTYAGKDVLKSPEAMADNCCYMPEKHYFPPQYRVKKLLFDAKISFPNYSRQYADKLCRLFQLNTEQRYKQLSLGYQSIFRIVLGLASNAPITIFDEPVLGLDAAARDKFYVELIEEFSRSPRLFIISTHLIEESADLFNEAIILKEGKVIRQAPVEELLAGAFYVTGSTKRVDAYIKNCKVLGIQAVSDLKTAVIEGDIRTAKGSQGLKFFPLTMQKLFIHLTNNENEGQ